MWTGEQWWYMKEGKRPTPAELASWESEAKSARGTGRMQMRKQAGAFEGGGVWKERKAELGIKSDGKGAAASNRAAGRGLGKNLEGGKPENKASGPRSMGFLPLGRLIPPSHGGWVCRARWQRQPSMSHPHSHPHLGGL